jgi:GTP-binding protein HflX
VHFWTHFEKQAGGIGQKGMGESQIEVDRRLVRRRISVLKDRLKEIEKERKVQRSSRKDVFKVALVGYTNAGKSTLLNALTHSKVLAENKLFATLDSSVRSLDPCSHPPIVAVDTVGFISRLPHSLIASFRSTLEEIREADLLLHVVDGSSNDARHQFEVVQEVLKDLELDEKPEITVLNKADQVEKGGRGNWARLACPGAQWVSALSEKDVKKLRDMIAAHFHKAMEVYEVSRMEAMVHEHGDVEVKRHLDKGTFYRVRMDQTWAGKLGLGKYRT